MACCTTNLISDVGLNLGVLLQCPRCASRMPTLQCPCCGFAMKLSNGIIDALSSERAAYYARFQRDYEQIRSAEGRGSTGEDFYLALPYRDLSGRNSRQWQIRARSFDYLTRHVLPQLPPGHGGRILDLGAGNCWMSFRLALAGYRPVAVDLLTNDSDGLGAAEHYRDFLPEPFPRFRAEMGHLPFQDGQFDAVIFNASFHYSEDYQTTLHDALRCVRDGGLVIISDTPWYSREESGHQMLQERRAAFLRRFGTASNSISSLEYLTDERMHSLEAKLAIRWSMHRPQYGFRWTMRPLAAKLRRRREPSQFRIYVTRKDA